MNRLVHLLVLLAAAIAFDATASAAATKEDLLSEAFVSVCVDSAPDFAQRMRNEAKKWNWIEVSSGGTAPPGLQAGDDVEVAVWMGGWSGLDMMFGYSIPKPGHNVSAACSIYVPDAKIAVTIEKLRTRTKLDAIDSDLQSTLPATLFRGRVRGREFSVLALSIPGGAIKAGSTLIMMWGS